MLPAAIILAGGHSTRMGRDKGLLPVGGVPLLQRTCDAAAACAKRTIVVTPWPDRYVHLSLGCEFVLEPEVSPNVAETTSQSPDGSLSSRGPLAGFARGLQWLADLEEEAIAPNHWLLLLACDMPYLERDSLQQGSHQLERCDPQAIALLHRHPKGWEPLCGFYRGSCLTSLQAFLEEGGRSFQAWLTTETVAVWQNANPQLFFNCNRPEDLVQVQTSQSQ